MSPHGDPAKVEITPQPDGRRLVTLTTWTTYPNGRTVESRRRLEAVPDCRGWQLAALPEDLHGGIRRTLAYTENEADLAALALEAGAGLPAFFVRTLPEGEQPEGAGR